MIRTRCGPSAPSTNRTGGPGGGEEIDGPDDHAGEVADWSSLASGPLQEEAPRADASTAAVNERLQTWLGAQTTPEPRPSRPDGWFSGLLGTGGEERSAAAAGGALLLVADLLARTAAFLLLKDSRSSFQIEGENPPQDRIRRWGQIIGEAGRHPIDQAELERLQRIVIGDARFVHLVLRQEGGFIGEHDRATGAPLPDHVSARHEDLPALIAGLEAFDRDIAPGLDPVLAAAGALAREQAGDPPHIILLPEVPFKQQQFLRM